MKKALEFLTTQAKATSQVLKGRALVETLLPWERNHVHAEVIRDGKVISTHDGYNSRIDAGAAWQGGVMGNAAGLPTKYIALAASAISITKTDTCIGNLNSSTNEITANGCGRVLGTYTYGGTPASTGAATSYTITNTFTCTTAPQAVAAVALFTAVSTGTMFVEANLGTSASLAVGDSLALTYTINI